MPAGMSNKNAVPVVGKVSNPIILPGTPLTITGSNLAWVDASAPGAVQLVDPATGDTTDAPVTARTTTTLTVTVPSVPYGTYRVAVTGPGGTSVDAGSTVTITVGVAGAATTTSPSSTSSSTTSTTSP